MARLALMFTVLTVMWAGVHFGVMGETSPEVDFDPRVAEEESSDRRAIASAHAYAQGGNGRPGPPRPGPSPQKYVECLACSGCSNAANATTKICPPSSDPMKNGKCVVYSEKYYHMKNQWTVRGCASERGNCADIKAALSHQADLVKLISCHDCDGDKCNGAGHSAPGLVAALVGVFITPLLMKYTLS